MRRHGFTLIELLVVIAIIAILAAILFPVFARAREKARQASCQSNLKQIALAFKMYEQDYDERTPGGWYVNWNATEPYFWCWAIYPYLKNKQLLVCPSNTTGWYYGPRSADPPGDTSGWRCSYGVNQNAMNQPLASVQNDAATVLNVDCYNPWLDSGGNIYDRLGKGVYGTGTTPTTIHNDGVNVSFFDGHVKWSKLSNLTYDQFLYTLPTTHADYGRPISQPYL